MFSRRSQWSRQPTRLTRVLERAQVAATPILDLTRTNPTEVGFRHPPELYAELVDPRSTVYDPAPLGLPTARAAIARYYEGRCAPERVFVCASTSEAYANLFALLCDAGDTVLVPQPGYPLLDCLADLAQVQLRGYELRHDGRWVLNRSALERALAASDDTRAIVLVSPNNPTGHVLTAEELETARELATEHGLAIIVDEVFADYPLDTEGGATSHALGDTSCLSFVLSGLSKVAALPQLKLAWGVTCGPTDVVDEALHRLEIIADTFLTVSTPVQLALPRLLAAAPAMQRRIRERISASFAILRARTEGTALNVLHAEAGWSAIIRVPALGDLDDVGWAASLVEHAGVLVQPGYLFDLQGAPHLVVSLLTEPAKLEDGIDRVVRYTTERTRSANAPSSGSSS